VHRRAAGRPYLATRSTRPFERDIINRALLPPPQSPRRGVRVLFFEYKRACPAPFPPKKPSLWSNPGSRPERYLFFFQSVNWWQLKPWEKSIRASGQRFKLSDHQEMGGCFSNGNNSPGRDPPQAPWGL